MKRIPVFLLIAALAALLVLPGCAEPANPGHSTDGVWGYVASADDAQLEVTGAATDDELVVERVLAPGDAWIVVHLDNDGVPGMRVGLAPVPEGESAEVTVELEGVEGDTLIVAVHADRGTPGEFDFSMDDPTRSPDRPYFVDGKELAVKVNVR